MKGKPTRGKKRIQLLDDLADGNRVANRPGFFGTVPNSDAVSRVPNGSVRDRLMSRIFTEQKVM